MYDGALTYIQTLFRITKSFLVSVGLDQGLALSSFIFEIIIDELSMSIWENVSWCMLFADDTVLVLESLKEANTKLDEWKRF